MSNILSFNRLFFHLIPFIGDARSLNKSMFKLELESHGREWEGSDFRWSRENLAHLSTQKNFSLLLKTT
jgi:hypothetical protein